MGALVLSDKVKICDYGVEPSCGGAGLTICCVGQIGGLSSVVVITGFTKSPFGGCLDWSSLAQTSSLSACKSSGCKGRA